MQQKESAARRALRKKRARRRALRRAGAAALVAALGALAGCVILPGMAGGPGENKPQAQEQTATAALGTIEKTVFGAGEVQPASQPGVYAQTDGKIAEYLVEVGDSVKAGDVVARLENDELDAEIAQLEYDLQTAQQAVRATQTTRSTSINSSTTTRATRALTQKRASRCSGSIQTKSRSARPRTG